MSTFKYQEMYPTGEDKTEYRLLTDKFVQTRTFEGEDVLEISEQGLVILSQEAFRDAAHFHRKSHVEMLSQIIEDPESSDNERYVVSEIMDNLIIAAEGLLPVCQDTGTAIVFGKKGTKVWTDFSDEAAISRGIFNAYTKNNFRYSIHSPLTMYDEKNTRCNLPAQIDLLIDKGNEYNFLFMTKSAGTSNKTFLFQETKTILEPEKLVAFMAHRIKTLGTAACPPYKVVFVVGGTSPEANLKTVKLATAGYLDNIPEKGNEYGHAFRCKELESQMLKISQDMGIGAQFGGKYYCHDILVIRMPRHGGSCPIGLGISSGIDSHIKGKITKNGLFLEKLEKDPGSYIPEYRLVHDSGKPFDLNRPMEEIKADLGNYSVGTQLKLTGKLVVARDMAHAKLKELMDNDEEIPQYLKEYVLYYSSPAKTPEGYASGSFGSSRSWRMDHYVPVLQKNGASMVMIGKGNRSDGFKESCKIYGGFYLCSIGNTAAKIGKDYVKRVETIDYPELGRDAIFMITVKDFPVFLVVDDKGNDFFGAAALKLPFSSTVMPKIL